MFEFRHILFSCFALFLFAAATYAQTDKLSPTEENKWKDELCRQFMMNSSIVEGTGVRPDKMQIVSFSRASDGKIERVRVEYQYSSSSLKGSWTEIYSKDDFVYAVVYSTNPGKMNIPAATAPGGATGPYTGSDRQKALSLQSQVSSAFQKEYAGARKAKVDQQQQASLQEAAKFVGTQTYIANKNGVSEAIYNLVASCLQDYYTRNNDQRLMNNSLTIQQMETASDKTIRVRGTFQYKSISRQTVFTEWADIWIDGDLPYIMYFSHGKLHDPVAGETETRELQYQPKYYTTFSIYKDPSLVYSEPKLSRLKALQANFYKQAAADDQALFNKRYNAVLDAQSKSAIPSSSSACLAKTTMMMPETKTREEYVKVPDHRELGGYRTELRTVKYEEQVEKPALQNTCKKAITIYGIKINDDVNDITYSDVSITLQEGGITPYINILPACDITKLKNGSTIYYFSPRRK